MQLRSISDPSQPTTANTNPKIARVLGVAASYLRIDMGDSDLCVPYTQCAASIQCVQPNDRVLVRIIDGQPIVEARLMREGETPVRITNDAEGNLTLEATQALRLRTPNAEIAIDVDGDLTLKANNIDSEAEQENRLTGRYVKLS
ncbi:hypothetical protein [Saccharospirillum salsuginis]|uniref:Uncharacterized protein n=1 Tax=Saccharospirillum salsuginis TaxID=418750 RepID=A0A918N599_9GAMM|nr:hypothetical protein [Saccharospirillum salsuginis]GGX38619.1 hypothetical protein GCM10007392_01020 [Saccharospirillum salsuginis]